jgi:hypothetical protein
MATEKLNPIKLGDRVKIRDAPTLIGRVVEFRGPLGPKGEQVYRIRLWRRPKPAYIEVLEEQLEPVPAGD